MSKYGVIREPGTIQFERLLPGSVEQVWEYLTESRRRSRSGTIQTVPGGRYYAGQSY